MRKKIRYLIFIGLVLFLLQPGITTKAAIDGSDGTTPIPLITQQNVQINTRNKTMFFSFIPASGGIYTISTDYINQGNIYMILNDQDGGILIDGYPTISYSLVAGSKYILFVDNYDCSGDATIIPINLSFSGPLQSISSVTVTPKTAKVEQGKEMQLSASVAAVGSMPTTVSWLSSDISNKVKVNSSTGLLSVTSDATPGDYTITAISTVDNTKYDTSTITVIHSINGYYKENTGTDTPLTATAAVPYGTSEAAAKAGLTASGYAKLSDNSYVPVTIDWTFDTTYDGNIAGVKAVTGNISGTFPEGQIPSVRTGAVTVAADTRTITGYYKEGDGTDTPLSTTITVPFGTSEISAKAGLTTSGYAKLSDSSYVPVSISWAFDTTYNGNIAGAKAVTGTVSGTFLGGQTPTSRTGTVTVEADTRTITGYFIDNTGTDTPYKTTVTVPFGTSEAAAKAALTTSGYAKLSDNSYVPVTISWVFDSTYNGNIVGSNALTGTVSGTFPGGQTPTNRTGTVIVATDTRTITGYYKENSGTDTPITVTATVPYGTSEATAKAGLTTSGYAKLSDNSYVTVSINWAFDSTYDGYTAGAKAVTGTVSGTFPGGQTPANRTGVVSVAADTRTITGYYKDNSGSDELIIETSAVPYGTLEVAAKSTLSTSGYAKLSDGSYIAITINWDFPLSYNGNIAGPQPVVGTVSGTFPGGQIPLDRAGVVIVLSDTRIITGYFKDNTGLDTPLITAVTVPFGTSETAAKAGLTSSGYAKLSDFSYVSVSISWAFDSAYDGNIVGTNAVTGTVSGVFLGGQVPTNQTGAVTVATDTRTITGYYKENSGIDTPLAVTATVPYGTSEAAAIAGLTTSGYAKLSDGSYVAVSISWAFDSTYDGNASGVKAVTGIVSGIFPGGQAPTNRTGAVTVAEDTRTIIGYYLDNTGLDLPLLTTYNVPYGTSEASAIVGLFASGYAKLSDNSYVAVAISWTFDSVYNGDIAGIKVLAGTVSGTFPGGQIPTDRTAIVIVSADTRTITGYFKENSGTDTPLTTTASVPYGTPEADAKAGLSTSGYAKLSDNSYVAVTISWTFDSTYDGNIAGDKAVTGTVSGTFLGGQTPTDRTGAVTVAADTRIITGYYKNNNGTDSPLTTTATVTYGTSEAAAKAGLSATGYAKLSDNSYVAVTISWTFDSTYDGNVADVKAVTGTVSGTFPGGQTPTNRTGAVTVATDTRTITGYYMDNTGSDTPLLTATTVPYGTSEASAKAGLATSGYAKLSDSSYVAVTISWTFDSTYDGNLYGSKAVTGTVSGTFPGGQTPTNRTGAVTVAADTKTITAYYKENNGTDTELSTTASVPYGTTEATALAGLTTAGYAKLSDNSYIAVTIDWTFTTTYNGNIAGSKAVTGSVSGFFPGGQIPTDRSGAVTVEADTRTITGYFKDNDGTDTPLVTTATSPYGTSAATAKSGLTSTGYAKLSDNSYVAVTISWAFDSTYNGNIDGVKAVTGTVSGTFPGGQTPTSITGSITIQAPVISPPQANNPTSGTDKIVVDVKQSSTENTLSQITIERTVNTEGKKSDVVTFTEEQVTNTLKYLKEEVKNEVRLVMPDINSEAAQTTVNIPVESLTLLSENATSLEIDTNRAKIDIAAEALNHINDNIDNDLFFNLVPVSEQTQIDEAEKRAKFEVGMLNGETDDNLTIVGVPMEISTNMPSTSVDITLPLTGIEIPEDKAEREKFLKQFAVYIEHSDGEKEIVQGEIVEYKDGVPGIRFRVSKFSTFLIVKTDLFAKSSECNIIKVITVKNAKIKKSKISITAGSTSKSIVIRLKVSDLATWKLYSDKKCTKELKSSKIALKPGENKIYARVTAADGKTSKIYTVIVTRETK